MVSSMTLLHYTDISKQNTFVKKAEEYALMSSYFSATLVLLNFIILFLFLTLLICWNCEVEVTTAANFKCFLWNVKLTSNKLLLQPLHDIEQLLLCSYKRFVVMQIVFLNSLACSRVLVFTVDLSIKFQKKAWSYWSKLEATSQQCWQGKRCSKHFSNICTKIVTESAFVEKDHLLNKGL